MSGLPTLPSLGQEILASGLHIVMGSSSAICAVGMTRLGAKVDFLGKVGVDYYGDFVTDELRRLGVGTADVIHDGAVRTGVTISLTYPDDRAMITYPGCIPLLRLEDINTSILPRYSHLHVGSYFLRQRLQVGLPELFRQARHAGLTISLDTGCDPDGKWGDDDLLTLLRHVDIFLPNEDEAHSIARVGGTEKALRKLAKRTRLVVVKCGASGAMSLRDGQIVHSPAFQVNVIDTTGAGDVFNAGFLYARIVEGRTMPDALRFANACGAIAVTTVGGATAPPSAAEVDAFIKERQ